MQPRIKQVSRLFRLLFQTIFVVFPVFHLVAWVYAPAPIPFFSEAMIFIRAVPESIPVLHQLSFNTKLYGFLVSGIPILVIESLLYFLIKLFRLYEQGEIFSLANVNYIKKTGYALLITQIARAISEGFATAIVTWHNPHGQRIATISLSGLDVTLVLTAFLIILISWIMAEGCRLREEQQLTI